MNSGDALTGGYIFKIDKLTGSSSNYWYSNQNVTYLNHYPDEDDITTAQNNYLHNYINSFENALYGPNYLSATMAIVNMPMSIPLSTFCSSTK